MARWNTVTIIAGVDFSDCRAVILDGAKFATIYAGSSVQAADGTPYVQRVNRGVKGVKFGTRMDFAEAAGLNDVRAAIQAAEAAAQAFRVQQTDALFNLDLWAIPDYAQETWLSVGAESGGIIQDVVMRFEAVALYSS